MDVGGVAGNEDAAGAVIPDLALVDVKMREPDGIAGDDAARAAPVENCPYLLERGVWFLRDPLA